MEIDSDKVLQHIRCLREKHDCKELEQFSRLSKLSSPQMNEICEVLGVLLENPRYTEEIGRRFQNLLLIIVTDVFEERTTAVATATGKKKATEVPSVESWERYRRKCIALSKLIVLCPDVLRYSMHFFRNNPAPFAQTAEERDYIPKPKQRKQAAKPVPTDATDNDLELVRCCYRFLLADTVYYRGAWDWSAFFDRFDCKGCPRKRYYWNRIVAIVTGMAQSELNLLDEGIPVEVILQEADHCNPAMVSNVEEVDSSIAPSECTAGKLLWHYKSNIITNIGDVMLPIFDRENYDYWQHARKEDTHKLSESELVVSLTSTKLNLRSLALGVSSGKAICLSGPVGSGKTSLVEYLAKATGRVPPKGDAALRKRKALKEEQSKKRKSATNGSSTAEPIAAELSEMIDVDVDEIRKSGAKNGFLRIQLGDQTDSKTLLGQYRCTDTPGEFVWQPGVLTQAVMYGYWLVLEDLDSATQDVCTVLTNLLENDHLSVPGFRDCLRIAPGFQLFVTLRSGTKTGASQVHSSSTYSLLEKYLYTVNIVPLSRKELSDIICIRYPKLRTVANRIVDIYLTFSSGCHTEEDEQTLIDEQLEILEPQKQKGELDSIATGQEDALPKFQTVSNEKLALLPSAGANRRLVSTRDLIKLCRRSDPSFSATSAECAYFVFQNAVDVFCSHLAHGTARTQLVTGIGGKIGILPSRCEHLCTEYKPTVEVSGASDIRVGRVALKRSATSAGEENDENGAPDLEDEEEFVHKRQKLDRTASSRVKTVQHRAGYDEPAPTFSFTRPAACLLERIAVAVSQNEPILLVGETGVGKTSSVQYLAYQTHHKLVVVNMNNQSDVSDLIGGYKPVDLAFVVTPLRYEFERLFRRTFNAQKNEKFLGNVARCYGAGEFDVLVKLMLKIAEKASQKQPGVDATGTDGDRLKWSALQGKLRKLDAQLKNSINVSFAFIPGSLVNCIRNGDWVLLDEINLASTETLECLSTILEPDGSIVLLERGDFVPVKRHPNFRIFACMNPSTDVGKKDLPVGIRNRFTEYFVDELLAENDLLILVNDYLSSTGIPKVRIMNTVKLYRRLRAMAQLELNDGLGNRPVFSLRTLCRALAICGKNLCGSIDRNLYEAFCISFLTQLDLKSHSIVLKCIQSTLLQKESGGAIALNQPAIPRPKVNAELQLNFEGYWIEQGPREVQECESYILTDSVRNNLRDLARIISIGRLPVLLQGPTSAGKTSLIEYIAKRSGNVCLRINNHEHTDLQEYIGTYVADLTGKLTFREGVLVEAMRNGHWIILDELNLAPSDILEALNRVLDDNRELFIPETQVVVKAHRNFMLFATQNPPGLYGGRKMLSRAFKNRFIELHFSDIPKPELEVILERRCRIPRSYAVKMVKVMTDLQLNRRSTTTKQTFTLRDLFRWGNRYTYADPKLLEDRSYDWNQHLIDEGYLVLSSKVRNAYETEIIREALFTHFRKRVEEANLFNLSATTSKVTSTILERLMKATQGGDQANIVWTFDMRRMAVLTAKALQFDEPVLLVGPTGCGKTTVCQLLASLEHRNLRILNCHMHTEGADFLGGLRPYRASDESKDPANDDTQSQRLFEWSDGPLVLSMQEGGFFLADEISLAEDSVLERLNCVLEPERTLLLAEKGGVAESNQGQPADGFVITAREGFQFLATMNPGGDFGKKELSPALRNRLTEIWCRATDAEDDLTRIAENTLRRLVVASEELNWNASVASGSKFEPIARVIIKVVAILKRSIEKLNFSIRDVLAWVAFVAKNGPRVGLPEALIYGLETVFLDSLEMLPYETYEEIVTIRRQMRRSLMGQMKQQLSWDGKINLATIDYDHTKAGVVIERTEDRFGIHPFYIELERTANQQSLVDSRSDFMFTAPTTQRNLFRLLSALSLEKAILLEGPPGVGKTSLIESLARTIGYDFVRINLCEHTDLADLFGTDLPADDRSLEMADASGEKQLETNGNGSNRPTLGSFVWRDGPLLAALKARRHTWILLDELNLAPQSVLEGLNAILDHRGEVFIAELNKTFRLGARTRIFAAQNPLRQGGGRKGLPQSFLNRFTKVYLRKLEQRDLLHVVDGKYKERFQLLGQQLIGDAMDASSSSSSSYFETTATPSPGLKFDLAKRMVRFSERIEQGLANLEFGYKGGPFEANLRDILRWCELLFSESCGYTVRQSTQGPGDRKNELLLVLFEKMKLVYYQRMRAELDKRYLVTTFSEVFHCDGHELDSISQDVGLYWTDDRVYLGDVVLKKGHSVELPVQQQTIAVGGPSAGNSTLVLSSQLEQLKSLTECVLLEKPVILCGPSDCGKTKLINLHATLADVHCQVDTIDDSVTGSFQQFDFNRHLEEVGSLVEMLVRRTAKESVLRSTAEGKNVPELLALLQSLEKYERLSEGAIAFATNIAGSEQSGEMIIFRKRLAALQNVINTLLRADDRQSPDMPATHQRLNGMLRVLGKLDILSRQVQTLNTGGHFEWVDSKVVKSIRNGQHICLEHVNLCSSAVLDRLNPVFEPNGTLLISEKGSIGGSADGAGEEESETELVRRHRYFQAFLTLDPRNGEISRAMRNRCVELAFESRDAYREDDLRKLIFAGGIHEPYLIEACLDIHRELRVGSQLDQSFCPFGVAHLVRLAKLVAQNIRKQGAGRSIECLKLSAVDVYVRSSNVDLLGFGLEYYRNSLKETIEKVIASVIVRRSVARLDNMTLRANDLTKMTRIRLQAEPFLALLRGFGEGIDSQRVLADLSPRFASKGITVSEGTLKYLLYFLYEISTVDDVRMRAAYLQKAIEELKMVEPIQPCMQPVPVSKKHKLQMDTVDVKDAAGKLWNNAAPTELAAIHVFANKSQDEDRHIKQELTAVEKQDQVVNRSADINTVVNRLRELNKSLYSIIQHLAQDKSAEANNDLPWSRTLFPRIRDYPTECSVDSRVVSSQLLLHSILDPIVAEPITKLSQIDLLSYSKSVKEELINDGIGNGLLLRLYEFLTGYRAMVERTLRVLAMNDTLYVRLIISNLWVNRLIVLSHEKMYEHKELKAGLLDSLTLHFQWIEKHCLRLLAQDGTAKEHNGDLHEALRQSISDLSHPLTAVRKAYGKACLEYLPLYTTEQIAEFTKLNELDATLRLTPKLGKRHPYGEFLHRVALLQDYRTIDLKRQLVAQLATKWNRLSASGICDQQADGPLEGLPNVDSLRTFYHQTMHRSTMMMKSDGCETQVASVIEPFLAFAKSLPQPESLPTKASKFDLECLPVLEYFLHKTLVASRVADTKRNASGIESLIRMDFVLTIRSLGLDALMAVKKLTGAEHRVALQAYAELHQLVGRAEEEEAFSELLQTIPLQLYRSLSSYWHQFLSSLERLELNSLALQRNVCQGIESGATYDEQQLNADDSTMMSSNSFHGALLTLNSLAVLLNDGSGAFRVTGFGELPEWRRTLRTLGSMLWCNSRALADSYQVERAALNVASSSAAKLLKELDVIVSRSSIDQFGESSDRHPFVKDFLSLEQMLRQYLYPGQLAEEESDHDRDHCWRKASMLRALTGVLELNVYVFLPLLDPVEKNRLKQRYLDEDIDLLRALVRTYDCMAITMDYQRLGEHNRRLFTDEIERLHGKQAQLTRKVALRPEDGSGARYAELVRDVNNFLLSCCHPATIGTLLKSINQCLDYQLDTRNPGASNNRTHTPAFMQKVSELITQIDLWIDIANQFEHHTLKRFETHYRDFLAPLCNSIVTLRYGLVGLRHCLAARKVTIGQKPNGRFYDLDENRALRKIAVKFVQFPCIKPLDLFDDRHKVNIYTVLEKLAHPEQSYFRLLKARLQEVANRIRVERFLGAHSFAELDQIVNVCNQVWQKQELVRRQRQAEEDSLYQTKSHCEEEDEEVVARREIHELFPSYVDEDFTEFIQNDTLEQVIKPIKSDGKASKNASDTIGDEDYKLICESFIELMAKHSRSAHYHPELPAALDTSAGTTVGARQEASHRLQAIDFVQPFETKLSIFYQLVQKYEPYVDSEFDEVAYGALSLAIGLLQEKYDDQQQQQQVVVGRLERKGTKTSPTVSQQTNYNFYSDANIPEVLQCVGVLEKIEERVRQLLSEWPDHAVLKDILLIIERIQKLPATAPIVRFSTGLQLLRQKLDEWNAVAHKGNNVRDLERDVVDHIHRWMRMELQYWRDCMSRTQERVRSKAYRYWFFMYNLLHEYLQHGASRKGQLVTLLDYRKVEKCYGEQEILDNEEESGQTDEASDGSVTIEDVLRVLKQFIESSSFAEYATRLRVMKSFEQYLSLLPPGEGLDSGKRDTLIAALYNVHLYFSQFTDEIEEHIRSKRAPIEKKLKDFVKIESFNKDLSYFSMRNNIARVHRQLHKFLKEFETEIMARVAPIFTPKDPARELNDADEQKVKVLRSEAKVTYYMVDVKSFMAPKKLLDRFSSTGESTSATELDTSGDRSVQLFQKIDRFFTTARNVCREAILHAPFPTLVYSLDNVLHEQIDTIEYLRGLEVDRSLPRPKQKSQAKQILNQKRKSLADFYKTLAQLGLSYRTGLMEVAIGGSDPVDATIAPFSLELLTHGSRYRKVDQHIVFLNDKLNLYYAKCVFKIKMLGKVMLQPDADIGGAINVERIKGFSIDLFLLVQNQRKALAEMVRNVSQLRQQIADLYQLHTCLSEKDDEQADLRKPDSLCFREYRHRLDTVRQCALDGRLVLEQFQLLLASAPRELQEELQLFEGANGSSRDAGCYYRESIEFGTIEKLCQAALRQTIELNDELAKVASETYLPQTRVAAFEAKLASIITQLEALREEFRLPGSKDGDVERPSYSVYSNSIGELLDRFERCKRVEMVAPSGESADQSQLDEASVNNEIENIIHSVLIAMQTIYKKYSQKEEPSEQEKSTATPSAEGEEDEADDPSPNDLQEQHLKQKINTDLLGDLQTLAIPRVVGKLVVLLRQLEAADGGTVNRDEKEARVRTTIGKLTRLVPMLEQYNLLVEYYLIQQLGAHKISTKMLSVMLTVFIELATKGFCVPKDLLADEQPDDQGGQQEDDDRDKGDKFGFEDGEGDKDASHKIESEDQLDDARKPGEEKDNDPLEEKDNKEEKGIEMSEDFESKLQDMEKPDGSDEENEENEKDKENIDKQMGETEEGAEKLDDQIWGDDEVEQPEEESMEEEEDGTGSNEKDERHNDLKGAEKEQKTGEEDQEQDGTDAIEQSEGTDDKKKQKPKDVNDMNNQDGEEEEEQQNPYHNELEEPPQPEELDMDAEFNLDGDKDRQDEEGKEQENPFDIDTMKDQVDESEEKEEDGGDGEDETEGDEQSKKDQQENGADSSDEEEPDGTEKMADEPEPEPTEDEATDPLQPPVPDEEPKQDEENPAGDGREDEKKEDESQDQPKADKKDDEHREAHDKRTEEDRVEAMPDAENKGTSDQVANDKPEAQQEHELDEQDTGEDKDGTGQAENEQSDTGHRGIAESRETRTRKEEQQQQQQQRQQQRHKQGNTDEDRSLGDPDKAEQKRLKTVEQLNRENRKDSERQEDEAEEDTTQDEFQHVKDAKDTDKTTMDNATEEQSKQVQHQEKEKNEDDPNPDEEAECADQLMEQDEPDQPLEEQQDILESEKNENHKDKPSKKDERAAKEKMETVENVEIEGETVPTATVARSDDTVAHTIFEILHDVTLPDEPSTSESLEMRKMVESEMQKSILMEAGQGGDHEAFEQWQQISHKMLPSARDLCEQLRLILEPTKCTRLKGDYRTGRRINMKKIIPYIASQFRKDKIWLRRTKAAQRDYKITIAIDDSKSMDHNNSKDLTLQAISLVSQALTLLESGRLNVMSFGEKPRILLKHTDQFDGPKLIGALNFEQNQSRIAELLKFVRTFSAEDSASGDNGIFEHLLIVLSDGRNIYSEGEKLVKDAVKLARLQRIFIVYIIIDNPDNKHSIMDVRVPLFTADRSEIIMQSYLDVFPFPYYVIVRDLGQLPVVLSDAMRQWFELVNSEQ
ncbi:midasin [Anopheles aquasalis]|uniref:midasin n=1 Tax=Anopheles aquasalis TaxID=42839 RepID=UPI00215AD8FA|nr:midasin [Anopheles aquasalis]